MLKEIYHEKSPTIITYHMLSTSSQIQTPPDGSIAIFRSLDGVMRYKTSDGEVHVAEFIHGVYRIPEPNFSRYLNYTGKEIEKLGFSQDGFVFQLVEKRIERVIMGGRGPQGPQGPSGAGGTGDTIESGTFTLSADGSESHITTYNNGNIVYDKGNADAGGTDQLKVRFAIADLTGYIIGQTVTNNTTGATGVVIDITIKLKLDTLTAGGWNFGDEITNGTNVTSITQQAVWFLTIPTTKKLKLWQGLTFETATPNINSIGISDGVLQNCKGSGVNSIGDPNTINTTTCINVQNSFPDIHGWTGQQTYNTLPAILL